MRSFLQVLSRGLPVLFFALTLQLAPLQRAEAEVPQAEPALWKVSQDNQEIYLFGTFHILPNDTDWRSGTLNNALSQSDSLWIETDTEDQQQILSLVEELAFTPEGQTLWSYFTTDETDFIEASLSDLGFPSALLTPFRPWFASIQLGVTVLMAEGYHPENGPEVIFRQEFVNAGKTVHFLETPEDSLMSFAGLSDEVQAQMFIATVKDVNGIDQDMDLMLNAWLQGDLEGLVTLMNKNSNDIPEMTESILYQRNRNWLPKIKALLNQEGTAFVAVGAAHLAGEQSVIELLEAEGFKVERQ